MFFIRNAEPSDLATIVRFNAAMAMETEGIELDDSRLVPGVQAILSDPGKGRYFMVETDGGVVAQTLITREWSDWRNGFWWWIQSVYVLPEWRRKGIFRALYEHIEAEAQKSGDAVGLRLYVDNDNIAAQKTYTMLGMEESRYIFFERTGLAGEGDDKHV
ncbi:MAG: GNAT family N-acetyltransferase [bacterium]